MKLKEVLDKAYGEGRGVGHFNFSDITALRAIVTAARKLNLPVMVGTSEGERDFVGVHQAVALVRSFREEFGMHIYLNADHTKSFEKCKEAVDAGYDQILFDGGKLPLEENIKIAKQVVEYAKSKNPDILVEGELGYIGSGSVILKELPPGAALKPEDLTKPEEAAQFVKETGVDMLAPAVGNFHGLLAHGQKPRLNIERIKAIKEAVGIPMVLHGGSGQADQDFVDAVMSGMAVVHINTEIRKAWRAGIEAGLSADPNEVTPSKILTPAQTKMAELIEGRLKLFARI